jgi:hypothetical protein
MIFIAKMEGVFCEVGNEFLLAYFPYFLKEVGSWYHIDVCVSAFEFLNQTSWNFIMFVMASEAISTAYFTNPSHQ